MRRAVIDLRSTAAAFRMPDAVGERFRAEAPAGWEAVVIASNSDALDPASQGPSAEALAAVADAEVYFGWGMPASLFAAARQIKWVQTALAGTGAVLAIPEMRDGPCLFTNAAGVYGPPIAETVLAGVLHLTRGLDIAEAAREAHAWNSRAFGASDAFIREIGELRVLVVGAGGLGTEIGTRFAALGATVVGLRRSPLKGCPPCFVRMAGLDAIDAELPQADVVVLSAALTEETRNALDARRLALLPAGAIVVNVSRGTLVDEAALIAVLESGRLRGAVLDVFTREPLASDSPLWQLRQVILTPHVSGVSPRRLWDRLSALFLGNWHAYAAGQPLKNVVDKALGY